MSTYEIVKTSKKAKRNIRQTPSQIYKDLTLFNSFYNSLRVIYVLLYQCITFYFRVSIYYCIIIYHYELSIHLFNLPLFTYLQLHSSFLVRGETRLKLWQLFFINCDFLGVFLNGLFHSAANLSILGAVLSVSTPCLLLLPSVSHCSFWFLSSSLSSLTYKPQVPSIFVYAFVFYLLSVLFFSMCFLPLFLSSISIPFIFSPLLPSIHIHSFVFYPLVHLLSSSSQSFPHLVPSIQSIHIHSFIFYPLSCQFYSFLSVLFPLFLSSFPVPCIFSPLLPWPSHISSHLPIFIPSFSILCPVSSNLLPLFYFPSFCLHFFSLCIFSPLLPVLHTASPIY